MKRALLVVFHWESLESAIDQKKQLVHPDTEERLSDLHHDEDNKHTGNTRCWPVRYGRRRVTGRRLRV
jgi:hypothetical protein